MPAVWVAHPKFVANPKNRDVIVRWLKAHLEAVEWILKDRKRTFELYKKYDKFRGFNFADELLEGLPALDRWPESVRIMQKNWIGRSEGMRINFALKGRDDHLTVFTTRHDTLFGASFCAIAADHPLAKELAADNPKLNDFIDECNRLGTSEAALEKADKTGFDTGLRALHPFDKNHDPDNTNCANKQHQYPDRRKGAGSRQFKCASHRRR